jgi:hypothetical protein
MNSIQGQRRKHGQKPQKAFIIAGASAVAVLLIGLGGWYGWQRTHVNQLPEVEQQNTGAASVKTETLPQQSSSGTGGSKDGTSNSQPTPQKLSGKKQVQPVVSYAGYVDEKTNRQQVEVDAFVPGILEEGGSCTLTATKDGQRVSITSTGHNNVSQTRCDNFVVDRSRFPTSGTWSVVVAYESTTSQGVSTAQDMGL